MKIGIAADHGGFELKQQLYTFIKSSGYEITDFGAFEFDKDDDYPDFIIPLGRAVADHTIERGIAVCGSGVGACIAANKIAGVRAALITDHFSAHQGVEDDDMNVLCLGGRIIGQMVAQELVEAFLKTRFSDADRHVRRLNKALAIENNTL